MKIFQQIRMDIYKYIFSILIILFSLSNLVAQDDNLYVQEEEKEPLKLTSIKAGIDVGRFTEFLFKPERTSYAGSIDVGFNNKYYVVLEFGISEIDLKKDNYHYLSDGSFWKLGMDFNMLKKVPTDFFGIGLRVGRASFEHYAKDVIIGDDHWGSFTTTIDSKSYNTYWFETSLGVKGELLKNIYFGWSALIRISVSGRKDSQFQPYYIPGFGKGENSINLGLNYFIYYQIPFNRK